MTGRDDRGRFIPGHPWTKAGGYARAAALTSERRREIAQKGYTSFVEHRFCGDREAAGRFVADLGAWGSDVYRDTSLGHFGRPELPMDRQAQIEATCRRLVDRARREAFGLRSQSE